MGVICPLKSCLITWSKWNNLGKYVVQRKAFLLWLCNRSLFSSATIVNQQYVCVTDTDTKDYQADVESVWTLMNDHWRMPPPRLIVSVTGGAQSFFMKKQLLEGFKQGLMKVATTPGEATKRN